MSGGGARGAAELPRVAPGRSVIWSGMALFLLIEATAISALLVSYFYLRLGAPFWPPAGVEPPSLALPAVAEALLLASVVPIALAERAARRGRSRRALVLLPLALLGVLGYGALTATELAGHSFRWSSHAYGSVVFTLSGYQLLHAGVLALLALAVWVFVRRGHGGAGALAASVEVLALYWYFVAGSSIPVFVTVELTPWLL